MLPTLSHKQLSFRPTCGGDAVCCILASSAVCRLKAATDEPAGCLRVAGSGLDGGLQVTQPHLVNIMLEHVSTALLPSFAQGHST